MGAMDHERGHDSSLWDPEAPNFVANENKLVNISYKGQVLKRRILAYAYSLFSTASLVEGSLDPVLYDD